MYSIYINRFNRNNSIINTEELMFAVPIINNAYINKPLVKSNEDAADSFSFSMDLNSPYYDAILPYKTIIRVEYDGDVIFWGRALPPSTSTILHTKTVQCEGTYTYFNDTYYEGVQEKHRKNITVDEYFTKAITNHNNMVPDKQIFKGNVQVTLPAKQEKYEPTSWTQTTSILSDLTGNNGGHMRVRYTNGNAYLDWYKYYIRDLGDGVRPSVTVGKNILDISSAANNGEMFTRIIPVGTTNSDGKPIYIDGCKYKDKDNVEHIYSGKAMPVSFVRNLYTSTQLTDEFHDWTDYRDAEDNYGIIYKVVSFPDADKQEKLFEEAKKWIKECYFSISSSFTVKAVDMHIVNHDVPKILLGDCVDVTFLMSVNGTKQWIMKKLVCKAVQYDLYNPENNSYTFGVPSDLLDAASRNRSKSSKKTASNNVGTSHKATPKATEDDDVTWRKVWEMIGTRTGNADFEGTAAALSFYENGEIGGAVSCFDINDFEDHNPTAHYDLWFDAQNIGKITLSGKPTRYVAISADRGIFAYEVADVDVGPGVVFWYTQHKGYKYEGKSSQLIHEEKTDSTFATDDGTLEGNKTFELKPKELSFPEYSSEKTYSSGSMITHDGYIYKCKTNISSPEAWNSSHWEQQGTASEGKVFVGFDVTSGSGDKWKIKLNTPVQYTDKDNNVKVADGFVTASDFAVQEIPSFKTKIGIFDIVIAGKVEAEQISADLAEVRKWLGDVISANTRITSAQGIFTNLVCTEITSGTYTHNHYDSGSMVSRKLEKCFYSFAFSESEGEITLTLYSLDGARSESHSFNMASTQFYIDAVEAAYEQGKEDGAGSVDASSIKGKNGDTHTSKPSGYDFGTLQDAIAEANESADGKWVTFQMYIDGNESDVKTYRVFVNGYG